MAPFGSRKPNVRRLRRRRNLDGLRAALDYRETTVDDDGEWDLGVQVRTEAAAALRDFEPDQVSADLGRALEDPQPAVRTAALDSIASFEAPVALDGLAGRIVARDDESDETSGRALDLLAQREPEGAAERVIERLVRADAPPLDDRHHAAVERLLDADPRGDAAREAAADAIIGQLDDPLAGAPADRCERVLGWLGDDAAEVVLEALNDGKASPALLRAAGHLGDARAVEPIVRELGSDDAEMRRSAAVAAGELNHTRTVIPLLEATQDSEVEVRNAASASLDQMGTAAVIAAMATFMRLGMEEQLAAGDENGAAGIAPADHDALDSGEGAAPAPVAAEAPPPADSPTPPSGQPAVAPPEPAAPQPRRRTGGLVERLFGRLE